MHSVFGLRMAKFQRTGGLPVAFGHETGGSCRTGHMGEPEIELDSIDAIENLVSCGLGTSIVPQRLLPRHWKKPAVCAFVPAHACATYDAGDIASCRRQTLLNFLSRIAKA